MKRIDYGRPPDLQLARSSSVLVEGEGGGESQQSSPSSPPSIPPSPPGRSFSSCPSGCHSPSGIASAESQSVLVFSFSIVTWKQLTEGGQREGGEEELALDRHSITGNGSGHHFCRCRLPDLAREGRERTRRLLRRRRNLQNANLVKGTHSFLPSRLTHSATSSPLPLPPLLPFPDADKSRWR